jgi:curved DNA-binding protein CbpA
MTHASDYYRILGVERDASTPEIRRAYRRLARQHHPDRNPAADGPEQFRTAAEAYAVLNDPARRARYDHSIRPASRRDALRQTATVLTRRGVLELSAREAIVAATMPLTLTATDGMTIMLPAGLAADDQITIAVPEGRAVLTVRVKAARKT